MFVINIYDPSKDFKEVILEYVRLLMHVGRNLNRREHQTVAENSVYTVS